MRRVLRFRAWLRAETRQLAVLVLIPMVGVAPIHVGFSFPTGHAVSQKTLLSERLDSATPPYYRASRKTPEAFDPRRVDDRTAGAKMASDSPLAIGFELAGSNSIRGGASFRYTVTERGPVRIEVLGIAGDRVRTLVDRVADPGSYVTVFDSRGLRDQPVTGGVFLARITAGRGTRTLLVIDSDHNGRSRRLAPSRDAADRRLDLDDDRTRFS